MDNDIVNASVVEVLESKTANDPTRFICRSGVELQLKRVPGNLINEATTKIPVPLVPEVWLEEKKRFEPNPNNPTYVALMNEFNSHRATLTITIAFAWGSSVITIPSNVRPPEDEEWSNELFEIAEIYVPVKGKARYAQWLKYVVLDGDKELTELLDKISKLSGWVIETDVEEAEDSFRDTEARDSVEGIVA